MSLSPICRHCLAPERHLPKARGLSGSSTCAAPALKIPLDRATHLITLRGESAKSVIEPLACHESQGAVLDEPTKGVDVGAKADIYTIIGDLASQGLGILVVSSYLPELLGICDRVIVLHDFGITGELPIEDATEEAVLRLASSAPIPTNV